MKKALFLFAAMLFTSVVSVQANDPVLMKINGKRLLFLNLNTSTIKITPTMCWIKNH